MTEQVIHLFIEQKTFKETTDVSYPFLNDFLRKRWGVSSPDLTRVTKYEIYNSFNKELDHIFSKMNLDRNILLSLRSNAIDKIALVSFNLIAQHLYKGKEIKILQDSDPTFAKYCLEKALDLKASCIVKIKDAAIKNKITNNNDLRHIFPSYLENDIVVSNLKFRNQDFRYRIYIDDRLLVERKYPLDIEHNRMIRETLILNPGVKGNIKIVSDFNLIFKRAAHNLRSYDVYSTEFSIPLS